MRREQYIPECSVVVTHRPRNVREETLVCRLGQHIRFDANVLHSYFTRSWSPIIYDAMLLAAAVEFCDRAKPRPKMDWARQFSVSLPVHDPEQWNEPRLKNALLRALECLTGDRWDFTFRQIHEPKDAQPQDYLPFPTGISAVIPYSDGLDSLAVSTIVNAELGDALIRVRVGASHQRRGVADSEHFAAIPYKVSPKMRGNLESSCRSRGFKFAMMSGLAAYLVRAHTVIVPESGQGALGPVLVNVGHAHPDRRTHPQFTQLMSDFLQQMLDHRINFDHPTLWGTKGESLTEYRHIRPHDEAWRTTRSCWKDPRQASVNGEHRQCGVCAACLIRRLSLHAAGLEEVQGTYVWDKLGACDFWQGADNDFLHRHQVQQHYALAGVLHLDHLANLPQSPHYEDAIDRQALVLSRVLEVSASEASTKVKRLVEQHASEWHQFLGDLPSGSFVKQWVKAV